uniref:Elongation factor-like 1 n=1 Tax=Caenorhabditis tropicalis TaxID=1561998 RepID=A0A1I7U4S8_9PELO
MESLEQSLREAVASKPAEHIRNVCLVAHVDHGKTSFADSLVSANAVISSRMAGKLRYMDSREDEQTRGITMKSSGITLLCDPLLINLIDSPGHVDFSGEVTSALILSDIALLLVDVIEGVCSQTEALIRQVIRNGQAMILLINKIDRLRVELKMSASEAYQHMARLIEGVNSCISQVLGGLVLEDEGDIEEVETRYHFDPCKGNVIFSSALHSFAFGCEDFAGLAATKLKIDKGQLIPSMFGDYWMDSSMNIRDNASAKSKATIFERLVLEPLWKLHDLGLIDSDVGKLQEAASKLKITLKSRRANEAFDELMRSWLPLPKAAFRAVARAPSARATFQTKHRLEHLTKGHPLKELVLKCDPLGITVVFVVKLLPVEGGRRRAICRVLSGMVRKGDELWVLQQQGTSTESTKIEGISILRGRDSIPTDTVTSGMICAIDAETLLQNTTLSSDPTYGCLRIGSQTGEALVRVSISTQQLDDMDELREKLKLLALLDTSLKIMELENGELAMITAGEVHLQKCIKDLNDLGLVDLDVSEPIVPFMETVIEDPALAAPQILEQETECRIREALLIRMRVVPLGEEVVKFLDANGSLISSIRRGEADTQEMADFEKKLTVICVETLPTLKGTWWYRKPKELIESMIERIWTFGPERARSNLLFNSIDGYDRELIWRRTEYGSVRRFDQAIVGGFELFCNSGPLCNEQMNGVGVVMEEWRVDEEDAAIAGQMMSAMRATCSAATKKLALRLVAAMYKCTVTTASQALGKVHAVLSQRKAKVISEDINEATNLFEVVSLMPVVESFSFCDQLRKYTSGMASAQLQFSHWQVIDEDPYWTPSTIEEIEEFGLKGDSPNHARGYMDTVRRRKGLPTEDLIVESAEKQRNLKKNK